MIGMFLTNSSVIITLHRISIQANRPTHSHTRETIAHNKQYRYEKDIKIIRINTITEKDDARIKNEAWATDAE